jgi:uncharacterized protein DUF4412
MKSFPAAALLLALSAPVLAQSEGVAEFKATTEAEPGRSITSTGRIYVTRGASRMEWEMDTSGFRREKGAPKGEMPSTFRMITIQKLSEPDRLINLDDRRRTYTITDLKPLREEKPAAPQVTYTVKKLGRDSVGGVSCEKAVVTSSDGKKAEICAADEISRSSAWLAAQGRRERSNALLKALHDNGLEGFPVHWRIWKKASDPRPTTSLELVRFEKKPVPASLFEIPPGYKKADSASMGMTPEQEKAMRESIEKLPPEQRKKLEEMMKKRQQKED